MKVRKWIAVPRPTLAEAHALGAEAADSCLAKAARGGFDADGARRYILHYLETYGPKSAEVLVDRAKRAGFEGHDDRCFGAVFGVLSRRGKIRVVGNCERRKGHGTSGGRIWEAT